MTSPPPAAEPSLIIYDGDCVFCQNYVRFFRLKDAVGPVDLIDARSGDPRVARYWRDGFDLDEGMLFVHGGKVHYGADAVNVLAGLSSSSGLFNKLNRLALSNAAAAAFFYPLLKLGRRVTLAARGKTALERPADLA
jgi:predicted DCC family thiol-disulfide oxidoreductase YuxK